jgi:two-component system response regulator PhoP
VKALLRRFAQAATNVLQAGPIAIDLTAEAVQVNGKPVELTTYEYRLLEYLARHRPRIVSKQELGDYLYPHDQDRDSNVVEVLLGRLRRKIDADGTLAPIETVRGRGYRFTPR